MRAPAYDSAAENPIHEIDVDGVDGRRVSRVYPHVARARAGIQPDSIDTAELYFAQAHALCIDDGGKLLGVSLFGPIMFVDAPSRSLVASEGDAKGVLRTMDGVFIGVRPPDQNVANTAVEWSGVKWTQMRWPLPTNERMRATIISHELYHRVRDEVGIALVNEGQNAHLDELDGRGCRRRERRSCRPTIPHTIRTAARTSTRAGPSSRRRLRELVASMPREREE